MVWNIVPVGSIPANNNKSIIFILSHIVSLIPFVLIHPISFLLTPISFSFIQLRFYLSHFVSHFVSIRLISFPFIPLRFHSSTFPFILFLFIFFCFLLFPFNYLFIHFCFLFHFFFLFPFL